MTAKTTPAKPKGKHGGARPGAGAKTAYKPEYCQIAIDTLSEGHSISGLAGKLGVSRMTVFNWRDAHPEFDAACQIGIQGAVYWWEQRAHEAAMGKTKGNPAVIIFGLRNRAAEDWRDRVEHTGADGGPIDHSITVTFK